MAFAVLKNVRFGWKAEIAALVMVLLLVAAGPGRAEDDLGRAIDALYTVRTADAEGRFLGSAFQYGDVGVSAAHVVGDAREVALVDAAGHLHVVQVLARDPVRDVAVLATLSLNGPGLVAAPPVGLGDDVYALGAPLGAEFSLTRGVVSAFARHVEPAVPLVLLQHDAAVNPGSSGGPLVNRSGQLVGMNIRIADGSRMFAGIAYAIGVQDLTRIVEGLRNGDAQPFPHLGLRARAIEGRVATALGIAGPGLLVDAVEPGSLVDLSGVRAGDVILAADGAPLTRPGDLAFAVEAGLPEGAVDLAILRGRDAILVSLALTLPDSSLTTGGGTPDIAQVYDLAGLGIEVGDDNTVSHLTENSPAMFAGMVVGDKVMAVNGLALDASALRQLPITAALLMLVQGETGTTRHLLLDPWGSQSGWRPMGGANVLDPAVIVF